MFFQIIVLYMGFFFKIFIYSAHYWWRFDNNVNAVLFVKTLKHTGLYPPLAFRQLVIAHLAILRYTFFFLVFFSSFLSSALFRQSKAKVKSWTAVDFPFPGSLFSFEETFFLPSVASSFHSTSWQIAVSSSLYTAIIAQLGFFGVEWRSGAK